jgi:type II secretory pathway component PulL
MDVVHAGPCAMEPDAFVLIRAYADAAHLRQSQEAFCGSEAWRQGPREAVLACIEAYLSVTLEMEAPLVEALRTLERADGKACTSGGKG